MWKIPPSRTQPWRLPPSSAVIGDPAAGTAASVVKARHALESADILAFLAERMAKWWRPHCVSILESLPVSVT